MELFHFIRSGHCIHYAPLNLNQIPDIKRLFYN
ncbi:hypothetical protein HDC30_001380 [Pseudomonas sp. JAI115]|nr:hypothetical protein [Pseudomonas sp. JAI115]